MNAGMRKRFDRTRNRRREPLHQLEDARGPFADLVSLFPCFSVVKSKQSGRVSRRIRWRTSGSGAQSRADSAAHPIASPFGNVRPALPQTTRSGAASITCASQRLQAFESPSLASVGPIDPARPLAITRSSRSEVGRVSPSLSSM